MRTIITAILLASTVACTPLSCEEVGCIGSLEISLTQDAWEDGTYLLSADFGVGEVQQCEVTLPLEADVRCDVFEISFDGTTLVVPFSTGMDESLTDVTVTLAFGADELVNEVISPEWSAPVYPNGEECDDEGCMSASWSFDL